MSLKLQYHTRNAGRSPFADNSPVNRADTIVSRIHQIQSNAKQICTDAADVEDARFLAENIVEVCRQILTYGYDAITNATSASGLQTERSNSSDAESARNADSARKAVALEKLAALSARELEIFMHLAEGRSATEISVKLSRSSKTINNHRTRILQKLGLKNATQLVRLAVSGGLVSV
jgi:DNA-binding NarL/FixJ family response regulator